MYLLLCKLWPYLAGGLIGWLLCGWFARRLKYGEPPVERSVEKRVEVEKMIDNPAHISRIGELEGQLAAWKRGPAIDLQAAKAAAIQIKSEDDFAAIEGIGTKINGLLHADGIHTFRQLSETDTSVIQKILDKAGANFQMANPGTWPDQADLAANNRWPALKALQDILIGGVYPDPSLTTKKGGENKSVDNPNHIARIDELEKELESFRSGPELDIKLAKAAGFKVKRVGGKDDFTLIEGIGPKINGLIHDAGIHSFSELARTAVVDIRKILDDAGPRYKLADPETWPAQSGFAATNQWAALKTWQDTLDGGKE